MSLRIRWTRNAREDLVRLHRFLLDASDGDHKLALRAVDAIDRATKVIEVSPFICRRIEGANPLLRELVIPFGGAGYVALFEIVHEHEVRVLAVRHQREDDYTLG